VNTVDRTLSILELFTVERPTWAVEEAAKCLGVSTSTAYRYFRSLRKAGLLDSITSSAYVLGPAIIEYDRQVQMLDPTVRLARPVMERLVAQTENAGVALLCRVYRKCVMCVHQEAPTASNIVSSFERGRLMPLFRGAASKIIFVYLPTRSIRWFFTNNPGEIANAGLGADWDAVKSNLRRIRKQGACVTRGEVDRGRVGIAAPIFAANRSVLGSVSMVLSEREATPQFIARVCVLVQAAAREIDAALLDLGRSTDGPDAPMKVSAYNHVSQESTLP